ncbi:MAG: glycosyltransferase family 9 protein [Candidatus Aminicenantes bacterium]|nr:glycosyltransferase family 9 protein [Candidatus Aminicenantes bacterium]
MQHMAQGEINHEDVLFIRLRLLGDIIFTIPAIQMFKKHHPQRMVHYLVEERFREASAMIPGVDNIITVPSKLTWRDIREFRKKVKNIGIRTVVDFHSGPSSALLTLASGASRRIGYRTLNRNWAYTDMAPRHIGKFPSHSVLNQARLLEKIGIPLEAPPPFPAIDFSRFPVSERLAAVSRITPKVVIHLGAGNHFRDWGMENFITLVRRLSARQIPVFMIGHSANEKQRAGILAKIPHTYDFSGSLSIHELLHLINGAAVYVGADSGPLHLASLTPTPLVAFFGPNLTQISGPWRKERVEILQLDMDCRPCSQRKCKYDTIRCMRNISVGKVYDAISNFIK